MILVDSGVLIDFLRTKDAKLAANWVLGEVGRWLNANGKEIGEFPLAPDQLASLARLVDDGKVTSNVGKEVFEQMVATGKGAAEIIAEPPRGYTTTGMRSRRSSSIAFHSGSRPGMTPKM